VGSYTDSPLRREQDRVSTLLKWLAKHSTSRGTYARNRLESSRGVSANTLDSCVCNHFCNHFRSA
jgi:hypothetical protein